MSERGTHFLRRLRGEVKRHGSQESSLLGGKNKVVWHASLGEG
jgi:hypothetical protein